MKKLHSSTCKWLSSVVLVLSFPAVAANFLDHWTTSLVSAQYGFGQVLWANGRYVTLGENINQLGDGMWKIFSSEDGITWTERANGGTTFGWTLSSLLYAGTNFFALGAYDVDPSLMSTDGISWQGCDLVGAWDVAGGTISGSPFYVGLAVAWNIAGSTPATFVSTDGFNWTQSSTQQFAYITFGKGLFVGSRSSGGLYSSTRGTNWTLRSSIGYQVRFYNGRFFSPISDGTNLLSSDGINWTPASTGLSNSVLPFTYSHGLFVGRTAYGYLATSSDGVTWTQYSPIPPSAYFATDGVRLLATISNNGLYAASSDPFVALGMTTGPPRVVLSGLVGRSYRIEYTDALTRSGTNTWTTLTNLVLPNNPYAVSDPTASNTSRFYRATLLP